MDRDAVPELSVAIIRARYNPFGGAERFVQRALQALSSRPLALTIIARRWQGGRPGAQGGALPEGVRWQRIDPFYLGSVWRDVSFARAVRRHLARSHYSLVQSHERIPGVMLYRAGDGVHAEFLAQRRRVLSPFARLGLWCNPYHAWMLRTERRMFEHPALRMVICNSAMVRDEIAQRFRIDPARLRLLRNGVDLQRFAPPDAARRAAARERFGLAAPAREGATGDVPVFAYVGSGFERKGLAAVLRAMADPAAPATARLLVAGADKHLARYRRLAGRLGLTVRVQFLGGVTDVLPVLHAADGFVLPTLYDPFPNAVLEALACGLPAITSTKSGAAEVIEPGRNGFVTDALDATAIARAMAAIASATPAQRGSMREAARDSVSALSAANMGEALVALYRELTPDRRKDGP